tara:strand:- start:1449 stop:2573 length:1125 start_codon:yes stop_codon:yes gene_type:complete
MDMKITDINVFNACGRNENDESNKMREQIVSYIMSDKIPSEFYSNEDIECSKQWRDLRDEVMNFVKELEQGENVEVKKVIQRGGRKYNYDISLITSKNTYNIEFKYNASTIYETPQFVSPMKPSQYLSSSYEEFYYTKYLCELCKNANIEIPDMKTYVESIHSNKPKCVDKLQELYYQGCKTSSKFTGDEKAILFYTYANMISKESIEKFIESNDVNVEKLNKYLQDSQNEKIYMMYKNGKFYKEYANLDNYIITSCSKDAKKYRYVCETKSGIKLNILLRWKNGNGIAFPAFQISQKKETKKPETNNIEEIKIEEEKKPEQAYYMKRDNVRYWVVDEDELNGDVYDYYGKDEDGDPAPGKKLGILVDGELKLF